MATGTNAIANEQEAKLKGGVTTAVTSNKGCTKTRAIELNCTVAGNYNNNQLVKYSDLSLNIVPVYYTLTFQVSSNYDKYTCLVHHGGTASLLTGAATAPSINIVEGALVTLTVNGSEVTSNNPNKKINYICGLTLLNGSPISGPVTTFTMSKNTIISVTSVTTTQYMVQMLAPEVIPSTSYFRVTGDDGVNNTSYTWVLPNNSCSYSGSVGTGFTLSGYTKNVYGNSLLSFLNSNSGTFTMPNSSVKLTPNVDYINYTLSLSWDPTPAISLYCNNATFKNSSYTFHYNDSLKFTSGTNTVTNNGVKMIRTISKISVTNNSTGTNTEYTIPCTITGPAANLDIDSGSTSIATQYLVTLFPMSGVTISNSSHASGSYISLGTTVNFAFTLASGYINPKVTATTLAGKSVAVTATITATGGTARFTMPAAAVTATITATAPQNYITSFSIDEDEGVDAETKLKLIVDGNTTILTKSSNTLAILPSKNVQATILPVTKEYTTRPYKLEIYRMLDWSITGTGISLTGGINGNTYTDTLSFTMPESNISIIALNLLKYQTKYKLSVVYNPNCTIDLNTADLYVLPGTVITVTFGVKSGYNFNGYTIARYNLSSLTGSANGTSFNMPPTDVTISVNLSPITYENKISILSVSNSELHRVCGRTITDYLNYSSGVLNELNETDQNAVLIADYYKHIGGLDSLDNPYSVAINSPIINITFIVEREDLIEYIDVLPCFDTGSNYLIFNNPYHTAIPAGELNSEESASYLDDGINDIVLLYKIVCIEKHHKYLVNYLFIRTGDFYSSCTMQDNPEALSLLCSRAIILINNEHPVYAIDFNYTIQNVIDFNWSFTALPNISASTNIDFVLSLYSRSIKGIFNEHTSDYFYLRNDEFLTLDNDLLYLPIGIINTDNPLHTPNLLLNSLLDEDVGFYIKFDGILPDIDPECYVTMVAYNDISIDEDGIIQLSVTNLRLFSSTNTSIRNCTLDAFFNVVLLDSNIANISIIDQATMSFSFNYNVSQLIRQDINPVANNLLNYSTNAGIYFSITYAKLCFAFVTKLPECSPIYMEEHNNYKDTIEYSNSGLLQPGAIDVNISDIKHKWKSIPDSNWVDSPFYTINEDDSDSYSTLVLNVNYL